jgi:hypothetical protein
MRRAAWLLALAAVAVGVPACSKSKPAAELSPTTAAPATTAAQAPRLPKFTLASFDLQAVNAPAEFPDPTRTRVEGLLDRYLTNAVLVPLRSGQPAGDLSSVFVAPALDRMGGPDRAALVDEGMPKSDDVGVTTASADIVALIGPDGLAGVVAGIRMIVTGKVAGTPLTIERTGELLLSPDGDDWKVSGYDIKVTRDTPDSGTTSTTVRQ